MCVCVFVHRSKTRDTLPPPPQTSKPPLSCVCITDVLGLGASYEPPSVRYKAAALFRGDKLPPSEELFAGFPTDDNDGFGASVAGTQGQDLLYEGIPTHASLV